MFCADFDNFEQMTSEGSTITTVLGGAVALKCDFLASNPPITVDDVQWFRGPLDGNIDIEVNPSGTSILYLDNGRYLYIRALTAEQRGMRYQCVVTAFNGIMRAPTTYRLDANIPNPGLHPYRGLGTQVGGVGETIMFVYVAANRNESGSFSTFGIQCDDTSGIAYAVRSSFVVDVTLSRAAVAQGQSEVPIRCRVFGEGITTIPISGTVIVSGELQSFSSTSQSFLLYFLKRNPVLMMMFQLGMTVR